jgi:hypothetical protein
MSIQNTSPGSTCQSIFTTIESFCLLAAIRERQPAGECSAGSVAEEIALLFLFPAGATDCILHISPGGPRGTADVPDVPHVEIFAMIFLRHTGILGTQAPCLDFLNIVLMLRTFGRRRQAQHP